MRQAGPLCHASAAARRPCRAPQQSHPLRIAILLGLACVALACPSGGAAPARPIAARAGEVADHRADLGELRERIEQLKREISNDASTRSEAADQLRDSERSISDLQRELRELGEQRAGLTRALRELALQTRSLSDDIGAQQAQLERLLVRQYLNAAPDALRLALSGRDANQLARELHYLNIIARERAAVLKEVEALLNRQREVTANTREQAKALAEVEAGQRRRHTEIARERDARKKLLLRLSAKIDSQRKEIGYLQRNEQRLSRVIERLSRPNRGRGPQRPTPESPAQAIRPPGNSGAPRETPSAAGGSGFARLRGSLRLPVAGTIAGRFGSARDGGGSWKGLFIRAATGGDVKAVAGGQVVFADWMRGFGNLLIVDHGDDYLSVYGYNDALLRKLGDEVKAGEVIASVGSSGGHSESGLYFEIRHQGQPVDPQRWTGGR